MNNTKKNKKARQEAALARWEATLTKHPEDSGRATYIKGQIKTLKEALKIK